jgi:hypothetical protein
MKGGRLPFFQSLSRYKVSEWLISICYHYFSDHAARWAGIYIWGLVSDCLFQQSAV